MANRKFGSCGWVREDWRAGAAICVVYGGGGGVR